MINVGNADQDGYRARQVRYKDTYSQQTLRLPDLHKTGKGEGVLRSWS
jgi:hypothetical protein